MTTTSVEAAEPELVEVTPGQMALIRWAAIEVYAQRLLEARQPESMPADFAAHLATLRTIMAKRG